ncbi:4'-phosphopantetheinyl transferase family protein [Clostridium butyricum]|nr:4'-phosphopantetheinyl transferase superfamily protein [Clostridium butyricum]
MQIYAISIEDVNLSKFNILLNKISLDKCKKVENFMHFKDKVRGILGEALLRKILISEYDLKNSDIKFIFNDYAKPFLESKNIQFNISHSGKWVLLGIDDNLIGVDIEEVKDINYKEISESIFNYNEFLYIKNSTSKLHTFYKLWTLKESYIKMIGKGMSIQLKSFKLKRCGYDTWKSNCQYYKVNVYYKNYILDNKSIVSICSFKDRFPNEIQIKNVDYLLN